MEKFGDNWMPMIEMKVYKEYDGDSIIFETTESKFYLSGRDRMRLIGLLSNG